jgi:regulator of RNase E activity RraA
MSKYLKFGNFPPTAYAMELDRNQILNIDIRGIWPQTPRIAGPAFTVQLYPGDNLMFHAAIYEAPAGSIIVADAVDVNFAVAGGNVCAIAQKNGIAGFVIDGAIRDLAEIRRMVFPVFSRGVIPIPGKKEMSGPLNTPITCGGVKVFAEDVIVADEEGIVVIPQEDQEEVYEKTLSTEAKDANISLEEWEKDHRAKIQSLRVKSD